MQSARRHRAAADADADADNNNNRSPLSFVAPVFFPAPKSNSRAGFE